MVSLTRRNGDDPFENFFLSAAVIGPQGESISISSLARDWYGQCWTFKHDTDAMWRIYSSRKEGVKIRTTIRRLFEGFYDEADEYASLKFFCGSVLYFSEADIVCFMNRITFQDVSSGGQATKFAELLCVKREAFEHENEIRLLFQDLGPKRGSNGVALFDLDINTVCDEVVLDPRLSDAEAAKSELKIKDAGCVLPVSQSSLYRAPKFTLRLQ
jgi:Protein of unknown function (DUF2971)